MPHIKLWICWLMYTLAIHHHMINHVLGKRSWICNVPRKYFICCIVITDLVIWREYGCAETGGFVGISLIRNHTNWYIICHIISYWRACYECVLKFVTLAVCLCVAVVASAWLDTLLDVIDLLPPTVIRSDVSDVKSRKLTVYISKVKGWNNFVCLIVQVAKQSNNQKENHSS